LKQLEWAVRWSARSYASGLAAAMSLEPVPRWVISVAAAVVVVHHVGVSRAVGPASRPGWVRDVAVPLDLEELRGRLSGLVALPARLFWSGPDPRAVRWDLADPLRRRDLYEIALVEGTLDDIRELVNGAELVRLWDQMYLPPWVRTGWQPLIDAAARQPERMPLDPLQERIARTALALPEANTLALAGGGAMIAHGFVTRTTKDIDLFTEIDDDEAVRVATALRGTRPG
jgi:hypothetical protein